MLTTILTAGLILASHPADYAVYDAGAETTADIPVAACLVAHGFIGESDDGHEWIYAPAEMIELCFKDTRANPGAYRVEELWV
jgi:hypothetical protein